MSPAGSTGFVVRPARPEDCAEIAALIRELAAYEKLSDQAVATAEDLHAILFGPRPYAEALIAEADDRPIGFALYYHTFSTFVGRPSLYLEDLFVRPAYRGRGVGKWLLMHLAQLALERGCGRMEWSVLDWNEPAIAFYRSLGARPMDDWTVYRIDRAVLERLVAGPVPGQP